MFHYQALNSGCHLQSGSMNLNIPNVNIWWHGFRGIRFLDIGSKTKHLKDLDLDNNPRMVIFHCMANNIGVMHIRRLLDLIRSTLADS